MWKRAVIGFSIFLMSELFTEPRPFTPRAFTVDDLLRGESIGETKLSPDGRWLAYVRIRPQNLSETYQKPWMFGKDRADIWLVATKGGKPRNLTRGVIDGSGFWLPVWSPDSRRLALLSTRGGNVRLWLLDLATGKLQKLAEQGVDISADPPVLWISDEHLLCAVMPEGEKHDAFFSHRQAQQVAMREWPEAMRGRRATASVLESGVDPMPPQGQLLLINTKSGLALKLAGAQAGVLRLSPDSRQVAITVPLSRWFALPSGSLHLARRSEVALVSLDARKPLHKLGVFQDIRERYFRWSPDGRLLSLLAKPANSSVAETEDELFLISLQGGSITSLSQGRFVPSAVIWVGSDKMLVLARPGKDRSEREKARLDWWLLHGANLSQNLTRDLKSAPTRLVRGPDEASFVGAADGDLWLIRAGDVKPKNLTSAFAPEIRSIVWPWSDRSQSAQPNPRLIFEATDQTKKEGENTTLYICSPASAEEPRTIRRPSQNARLSDLSNDGHSAVLTADERDGTYLWVSRHSFEHYSKVAELNMYLREIAEGQRQLIDYRSVDGEDLKAQLTYPYKYEEGKRYPLVVEVYPGTVVTALGTWVGSPLPGRGYALLQPSMPLKPGDHPSAPLTDLPKSVLPAIDKVVEMGVADPERIAVIGQSYGGYAVLGLITQTRRFRAAIAQSPISNWISLYGTFVMPLRYSAFTHEIMSLFLDIEIGQQRMNAPPWADPGRYIQNSPLFHAEKVETPVMIIQGDIDYSSIGQGEEFFTALYRLGKRARFVRYWGEGHRIDSPANIRDMWERIFAWLDECLKPQIRPDPNPKDSR